MSEEYRIQWPIIELPKPAGYWIMPGSESYGTKFAVQKKPNWLVRQMMRLVFGFKWEDFK